MTMPSTKGIRNFIDELKSMPQCKETTENEDTITQILLKLPVKDLLRLKCAAREFNRRISNPRFGYLYFHQNLDTSLVAGVLLYQLECPFHSSSNFIFLNEQTPKNPLRSLSFLDARSDIHRMSSCNGMLCLCIIRYGFSASYDYYVCNPTTNQSIKLPELSRRWMSRILSMNIAFDPERSPFFEVLCVWIGGEHYHFSIYSSETKLWRDTDAALKVGPDDAYEFTKGVFCFNSVHWVREVGPFLRFDMDKECCETMAVTPVPQHEQPRKIQYFGECNGSLYLSVVCSEENVEFLGIYHMERENSRWLLEARVNVHVVLGVRPGMHIQYSIHCILRRKEENELFGLLLSTPSVTILLRFRVEENTYAFPRLLVSEAKDMHKLKWYHSHKYIMTLTAV